jgi:ParB family chromosome partitioning protein
MGKLDELMRASRDVAAESMGAPRATPMHGTSGATAAPATPARLQGIARSKAAAEIPVDRIAADPDQPREEFDEEALARLAESLRTCGQLQPIRVRWDEGRSAYVIVCGERRWRAAAAAGLKTLTAIVEDKPRDAASLLSIQLIENALREDLNPVDQARAFRQLMEANGWSARQVARELSYPQASVAKVLRVLELPEPVQVMVEQGRLSVGAAFELREEAPEVQVAVAGEAVSRGLTRSGVAQAVRAVKAERPAPAPRPDPVTLDLGDGLTVTVRWRKPSDVSATQALRKALKAAQEQEARGRAGEAA